MAQDSHELIVLGCGDAFGSGGRGYTSFFYRTPGHGILIDAGPTVLQGLKREGLSTDDIDLIILSHFHGDHFGGMPNLLLDCARAGRTRPLTILSPPGARAIIRTVFEAFYAGIADKALDMLNLSFQSFSDHDEVQWEDVTIRTWPVKHTPASLPHGLRVESGGKTLAYSGDTEWTDTLPDIFRDADLGICECCFFDKDIANHLRWTILQPRLGELKTRQLLLTHFDENMLAHLSDIVGAQCAQDGMHLAF